MAELEALICASGTRPSQEDHRGEQTHYSSMDERKVEKRVGVNGHFKQRPNGLNVPRLAWTIPTQVSMNVLPLLVQEGGKIQPVHVRMGTIAQ